MFDMLPIKMTQAEFDALPEVRTPQQELKSAVGVKYKTPMLSQDPHYTPEAWWYAEVVSISSYGAKIVYRPVEIVAPVEELGAWG